MMKRARTGVLAAALGLAALAACDNGLSAPATALVLVPGGSFTLGSRSPCSDAAGLACAGDRAPHQVSLTPFVLETTEVTRLQYATCVVAGACRESAAPGFDANHKDDPVLVDNPQAAREYCRWRGLGLPTEAQFEVAARLGADMALHDYPWGDAPPMCGQVAFAGCGASSARPVASAASDVTALGIHDLAGGAPEWVEDAYDPHAGCLDRIGWSDACDPADPACPAAHCIDETCLRGCLPPAADKESTMTGARLTDTPQCPLVPPGTDVATDPVIDTSSDWGVVRGAGALDGACGLAGWTRRHATPGSYHAGFRCGRIASGSPPKAPASYRFRLTGCPAPDYPVSVSVTGDEQAIDFALDHLGASGPPITVHADGGAVHMLPCGDLFIVRPSIASTLTVQVNDGIACAAWRQTVGLDGGGDVPASGADRLPLAGRAPDACALPHATGSCTGACRIDSCTGSWRDCDGRFANGCEVDVGSSAEHCGACGRACPTGANATVACVDSVCRIASCSQRFASCDDRIDNGCETDLASDVQSCGGCRTSCSQNHVSSPSCAAGVCGGSCDPGYQDCNGNKLVDGCEINVAGDPTNCGGCGTACSQNHLTASCTGGQCTGRCLPDFADCNNDKRADGCEASLLSDPRNCGGCGNVCPLGRPCSAGLCN